MTQPRQTKKKEWNLNSLSPNFADMCRFRWFASNITFLPTSDHFWLEPLFSSFSFQFPYGTCYIHFSVKISWYYFIWREINSEKFDEADLLIRLSIFSGSLNLFFLLFLLLFRFNLKPQSTHKNRRIEEDEEMV